ncbi:unnamed protein product [Schistosoma margrebowiei]|uniref:Uncharacterized protein n=1 Tax=Schistosoma margrebowiei TaxID=48269 RepID=A0A183LEK7_9TREM|nr:unnamed protein product [Schistosoma margrebowiei]
MRSVKPASTRPQSTDVFIQPDLRYSTHVFVRRDSHRRPFESAYKEPFKILQREPKYYIIDKNGTNDSISIDRLKAAYLEGNPIYVDFPSVQLNDTTPTLIMPHPTTNTHDDSATVSENKLKTTRSGRRVRFPEHLNDYCTKERRPDAAKFKESNLDVIPNTTCPHNAFISCGKLVQCEARVLNELEFDYNSDDFISTAVHSYHEVTPNTYSSQC